MKLAEVTKVPSAYLSKVLQNLSRAGIVRSQRGVGGGVSLASEPKDLTIFDVVSAVEPMQRIKSCPLELEQHGGSLCPLHSRLDNAMADLEVVFRQTTLEEILSQKGAPMPLCDVKIT